MLVTFDVNQRFEASDNPDLERDGQNRATSRTSLGIGLESVRPADSFNLNIGADIEGRSGFETTRSFGTLGYVRETRSARAAVNLRFRENDINGTISDQEFDEDGALILQDGGTRRTTRIGLEGAVGREAPIGASFDLGYNDVSYEGATTSSLRDNSTVSFNGRIDFRITPRVTTSLISNYSFFDAETGGVDRETFGLGVALQLETSDTDEINLSLRQDRIERSGSQVGTDEGLSLDFGWSRALPNGSLALSFGSDVSSNASGRRSNFTIRRAMELPRGSLSFAFGLTKTDSGDAEPLMELNYRHELPSATLSVGLRQTVNTTSSNDEELNTRLRASYSQRLNAVSSLDASLSFFDRKGLSGGLADAQLIDLGLSYRRELTQDWGLVGGVSRRISSESGRSDNRSSTVFLGVERSFSWLP